MFKKMKSINVKKNNRLKILLLITIPTLLIIIFILLITTNSLSDLMGNSVTSYYCEDASYTLKGNQCIKEIKTKAATLGDVNLNQKIDEQDVKLITEYIDYVFYEEGEKNLSDLQIKLADINEDGKVYYDDESILKEYLDGTISTYGIYQENIGVKLFCEDGYALQDNYCIKKDVKTAKIKNVEIKDEKNEIKNIDNTNTSNNN